MQLAMCLRISACSIFGNTLNVNATVRYREHLTDLLNRAQFSI